MVLVWLQPCVLLGTCHVTCDDHKRAATTNIIFFLHYVCVDGPICIPSSIGCEWFSQNFKFKLISQVFPRIQAEKRQQEGVQVCVSLPHLSVSQRPTIEVQSSKFRERRLVTSEDGQSKVQEVGFIR